RTLLTLAIETSCDDTSVAVLETDVRRKKNAKQGSHAILHYHEKATADNTAYRGIHPVTSLESHQTNLAQLVKMAMSKLPKAIPKGTTAIRTRSGQIMRRPDFIAVTRGPGMWSNLSAGLDTAKGLAVAWDIPLIGVHHMAAHALTPRLASALVIGDVERPVTPEPNFPFLSVLVSGGHSLIILTTGVFEHEILASTSDTAIGETLDKIARLIVPKQMIDECGHIMYARLMERFAFPNGADDYEYTPPKNRGEEMNKRPTAWGWGYQPPLGVSKGGPFQWDKKSNKLSKEPRAAGDVSEEERRDMAREAMRVTFEHLATRVVLALRSIKSEKPKAFNKIRTVVLSGGVASNQYLRHLLSSFLASRGFSGLQLVSPPVKFCTDNAAMIAWAGIEMYNAGHRESALGSLAVRKWPLD
ncbi:glycoprotease pgp1, partial [Saccharata proteae CBS 121410]